MNEQTQSNSSDQLTSKFISGRYLDMVNSNLFKPKCLPGERYDTDQESRTKYCSHKCAKINDE